jgi:CRP-like cAMP-binding protein
LQSHNSDAAHLSSVWPSVRDKRHALRGRALPDHADVRSQPLQQSANAPEAGLGDRLAATWLTHELDAAARNALATIGRYVAVPAGSILMREGEPNDTMAIVLDGRVSLRMRVPERGQVSIVTIEPGDLVGWSAMVPPYRATSTAVALTDTELAQFEGPRLRELIAANSELGAQLYPMLLKAVARRLEGTRLQLLDLFDQGGAEKW